MTAKAHISIYSTFGYILYENFAYFAAGYAGSAYLCNRFLTSVTIPDSVTSINYSVFYGCSSLSDVYYGDGEDDWNAVEIGSCNEYLTSATIHYNSTGDTGDAGDAPTAPATSGDLNGDGEVNAGDLTILDRTTASAAADGCFRFAPLVDLHGEALHFLCAQAGNGASAFPVQPASRFETRCFSCVMQNKGFPFPARCVTIEQRKTARR
ncbi:MAG: hypothetical protein LUG15_04980 [Oscillospiraceae bacterium]|nr:hypothetical protein [Oscillospiraceae bacterium]